MAGLILAYVSFPLIYGQMKVWFLKTLFAIEQIQKFFIQ
jgi:hypothetical protein